MIIYMIRVFTSDHATADKFIWTRSEHEAGVSAGEHRRTEGETKVIILLINQINHFIDFICDFAVWWLDMITVLAFKWGRKVLHNYWLNFVLCACPRFGWIMLYIPPFFSLCRQLNVLICSALTAFTFCHKSAWIFYFNWKKDWML